MATPLYTFMRPKGTTLLTFPSGARDYNTNFTTSTVKFSKFICLNFPKQVVDYVSGEQTTGVMNFTKYEHGPTFYNFEPGSNTLPGPIPSSFADQLVESLRNYVANYDETEHDSRVSANKDFYNVNESQTPTEEIFWKWCRKLNLMNLEPAYHKIDWDKNLTDFANPNTPSTTATDYFRQYLWKEREIINYTVSGISYLGANVFEITVPTQMKIKNGDSFIFTGNITTSIITTGVGYTVSNVTVSTSNTTFNIVSSGFTSPTISNVTCYLNYNRFVQYIGEIQYTTQIQTSRLNFSETSAQILHHQGQTPTVLFQIIDNTNYYPNLELPALPGDIQPEINGAQNLNSPIRVNPSNYAGSYYGYFDTANKTYYCSNGDKLRKSGDYYGVLLSNNIGLNVENYFYKLNDFNSDNIDGVSLDFDKDHYYKMNLPNVNITNFDDFNSYPFNNQAPKDFEFNAILWYYEIDNGSGQIIHNLYSIEFLNNPSNDLDPTDPYGRLITPVQKLVTNGTQDGTSYIYNMNNYTSSDNTTQPLNYDPTTLANSSAFDLYQRVLQQNALIADSLITMISGFTNINTQIYNMQSLIYSQTDVEILKNQMTNMTDLLQLYSKMQMVDSPTNKISIDYSGNYPQLSVDAVATRYAEIEYIKASDIYSYNSFNSGQSFQVVVPESNQKLIIIQNDLNQAYSSPLKLNLNKDLNYGQQFEISIEPNLSSVSNQLQIDIDYVSGSSAAVESYLITVNLPTDVLVYNSLNPSASTFMNSYYTNSNVIEYSSLISNAISGITNIYSNKSNPLFTTGDLLYIDNFYLVSGSNYLDISGAYTVNSACTGYYRFNFDTSNYSLVSNLSLRYYKGMDIQILRVSSDVDSSLSDRYTITKELY